MRSHIKRILSRARYAALGAAIGGGLGGLISRNAASTGAAMGALVGATIGEKRISVDSIVTQLTEERNLDAIDVDVTRE